MTILNAPHWEVNHTLGSLILCAGIPFFYACGSITDSIGDSWTADTADLQVPDYIGGDASWIPADEFITNLSGCDVFFSDFSTTDSWRCEPEIAIHRIYQYMISPLPDSPYSIRLLIALEGHRAGQPDLKCNVTLSIPILAVEPVVFPVEWTYCNDQISSPYMAISASYKNTWPSIYTGEGAMDDIIYPRPPMVDPRNVSLEGFAHLEEGSRIEEMLIIASFDITVEDHEGSKYRVHGSIDER